MFKFYMFKKFDANEKVQMIDVKIVSNKNDLYSHVM